MAQSADDISMALFCDFENIALGVRDAQYEKFDIKPILERLLLKGSIVVKKAYCDWERYKSFKGAMHEANFELIEIPHVRMSGKNSADIRMVVDALDLCYTKAHVNTFVIISGDSDFSPLVSKLRENAKRVIGVGVKQSTSDLLIANCDEFIYIDDLMRKRQRDGGNGGDRQSRLPADPQKQEELRLKGMTRAVETLEALLEDRADDEKVWASVLKEAIKRRHPGFNENYHGFKTFGGLLEEASKRGLLEFGREANSAYVKRRAPGSVTPPPAEVVEPAPETTSGAVPPELTFESAPAAETPAPAKRRARGGRKPKAVAAVAEPVVETAVEPVANPATEPQAAPVTETTPAKKPARKSRAPRAPRRKKTEKPAD
jgi:uncharacterized protein (TIGR00288 family)